MKKLNYQFRWMLAVSLTWTGFFQQNAPAAEAPNASPGQSLSSYKIISERNIFNANRRSRAAQAAAPVRSERPPKIESISLTGTMLHEGGMYAFFDGTEAEFRNKVLKPGDTIAGHKILEVGPDSVKLEAEEAKLDLPLGMQLQRREREKWQVLVGSASSGVASSNASSFSNNRDRGSEFTSRDRNSDSRRERGSDTGRRERGSENNTNNFRRERERGAIRSATPVMEPESKPLEETSSGGSADDVLKRLMQKREQELSK